MGLTDVAVYVWDGGAYGFPSAHMGPRQAPAPERLALFAPAKATIHAA
jgi:hypothetical protein